MEIRHLIYFLSCLNIGQYEIQKMRNYRFKNKLKKCGHRGQCLECCPFEVPVIAKMKQTAAFFS